MIDIPPGTTAADGHGSGIEIDARVFDLGEIDHQGVIGDSEAAGVVPAATNREQHFVFPGEIDASDDVRDVHALCDQARLLIDHRVVNFAGIGVIFVGGLDHAASQYLFQFANGSFIEMITHNDERPRRGYNPLDMKHLQLVAFAMAGVFLIGCETTNQNAGMGNQEQKRLAQIQRQQQEAAQYDESDVNLWNAQVDVLNSGTNPAIRY
jgi:hypothetical protein